MIRDVAGLRGILTVSAVLSRCHVIAESKHDRTMMNSGCQYIVVCIYPQFIMVNSGAFLPGESYRMLW